MPRSRTRSAYSPQQPPPPVAPDGVAEVVAWQIAAQIWHEHRPEALMGLECDSCKDSWPCDAWQIADSVISDCLEGPHEAQLLAELRASHSTLP